MGESQITPDEYGVNYEAVYAFFDEDGVVVCENREQREEVLDIIELSGHRIGFSRRKYRDNKVFLKIYAVMCANNDGEEEKQIHMGVTNCEIESHLAPIPYHEFMEMFASKDNSIYELFEKMIGE